MCGIIGYNGEQPAAPLLFSGLKRLEYRGYDSAGIAVAQRDGIRVVKSGGRLEKLRALLDAEHLESANGIGHTRWATHGEPNDVNAHPHSGSRGLFTLVHNGIIENYSRLKNELTGKGIRFASETDTEVAVQLMEDLYDGDCIGTVIRAVGLLEGSFALGILCSEYPDLIFCARRSSPLIIGIGPDGTHLASDISAIADRVDEFYRLEDNEFAVMGKKTVVFYNADKKRISKHPCEVTAQLTVPEKNGYEHFMLKEIHEQPEALRATICPHISGGRVKLDLPDIPRPKRIYIVACGSAYHVGMVAKYYFEQLLGIPTEADIASEFRYRNPLIDKDTPVIIISQSGETADSLAALREAKKAGALTIAIVNVPESSIARESDSIFYTRAGAEIAVATTKAYSSQLAAIYLFGIHFADKWGTAEKSHLESLTSQLLELPDKAAQVIGESAHIKDLANRLENTQHAYFIGRNVDFAAATEASLKLKEISYVHSEAYAAGELKHGTISLIEPGTPVVALCCTQSIAAKTVSNIKEVRARGAYILCVTTQGSPAIAEADDVIIVPQTNPYFSACLQVIPMQLFAYFTAKKLGCDIDKPRNLAKSVTVE